MVRYVIREVAADRPLADVMQAPRDRRMLKDFEKALRENAAFVPAALDRRPETMRVVFSIQRVDVYDRNY